MPRQSISFFLTCLEFRFNCCLLTCNMGLQDYDIDVAAGVDTAMIAALAVIYNEYVDSTKDGGSSSSSSSDNEAKK